jgi:hypothetical protein
MMSNNFIHSKNKELFYSYDGAGNFNTNIISHGDIETNIFMQQMWDNFHERLLKARKDVLAGKQSPLCYHMERIRIDFITLSVYMRYQPWRVKLHFRPGIYKRLKPETKAKYAEVFDIPVEQLENVHLE